MNSLAFVTPAYLRFELTEICLSQRADLIKTLYTQGVDATCIVIADDDNLDIAKGFGFETVERNNNYLGRRFNDGYALAAKLGIDLLMPIGSDSWLDKSLFENLPQESREITTHLNYSLIDGTGTLRADTKIVYPLGIGYIFPTELVSEVDYRPCGEFLLRGCDMSTHDRLMELGGERNYFGGPKLQHVGFNSGITQISSMEALVKRFESKLVFDPFEGLDKFYDEGLIKRIKDFYASGRSLQS